MISERMLRKWRFEALQKYEINEDVSSGINVLVACRDRVITLNERMLLLTQELLDQKLLEKGGVK